MRFIFSDSNSILYKFVNQQWDDPAWQSLRLEAFLLQYEGQEDGLAVLDQLEDRIRILSHQVKTAIKVKNFMKSRAILADEVGLGKTIEAGIIIKELICKGLAEKVLILTPPSLTFQWKEEMLYKFSEKFIVANTLDREYKNIDLHEKLIVSLDSAKRGVNCERIKDIAWDMLIVDEAHRLKNRTSLAYNFVKEVQSKYFLMLTATPLQNNLRELYNLMHLLKPGLLGTWREFKRDFVADLRGRVVKDPARLQSILSQVMVRTTRRETEDYLKFTERIPHAFRIRPTDQERRLYQEVTRYIKRRYFKALHDKNADEFIILSLMTLQRQLTSSSAAVVKALQNRLENSLHPSDILELSRLLNDALNLSEDSKLLQLLDIMEGLDSKMIIFTTFIDTQRQIARALGEHGIENVIFSGEMSYREKNEAVERFKERGMCLICTEAGSEGMNLQFCHKVVNYDLPWNPMRVEQRIGRIHRIGQDKDVHIYNFVVKDTVEDYILNLLYEKIKLFELTIGDLELILGDAENYDRMIFEEYMRALDHQDFENKLGIIKDHTLKKKSIAEDILEFDRRVFENFDLSPLNVIKNYEWKFS